MSDVHDDTAVSALAAQIDDWLAQLATANPAVEAVDRGEGDEHRWYVRLRGEEKDHITVWLTLGQRTLRYEAYVMPAPRGERRPGVRDGAAPQREAGRRPLRDRCRGRAVPARRTASRCGVFADEVDRVVGSIYAYCELSLPGH